MTATTLRARASFIPFTAMTATQQVEHLLTAHGFGEYDEDEGGTRYRDGFTGDAEQRAATHAEDHAEEDGGPSVCKHTHSKPVIGETVVVAPTR